MCKPTIYFCGFKRVKGQQSLELRTTRGVSVIAHRVEESDLCRDIVIKDTISIRKKIGQGGGGQVYEGTMVEMPVERVPEQVTLIGILIEQFVAGVE